MPRIYIAGPMTGIPEYNYPAFNELAEHLREAGWDVVNPAELCTHQMTWAQCMRADIKALVDCTHIYMLDGWRQSKGAKLEHAIATALGMTVIDHT
jgi:nucleoside 2-deoxyribosyltransferase